LACFYRSAYAVAGRIHFGYFGIGHNVDAGFLKAFFQLFGYFFIFYRHNPGHELNDGNLGAHAVVKIAELHPDGAAAHNDHAFWLFRKHHGFAVADDLFAINGHGRQLPAAAAGGNDNMTGFYGLLAVIGGGYFNLSLCLPACQSP
jgi:hypothetical protein